MRRALVSHRAEAIFMGEIHLEPAELSRFFGDGDEMHLILNFLLAEHLVSAIVHESAEPLRRILGALPQLPANTGWANFLRNHDELDLSRLPSHEQEKGLSALAPEKAMRIYNQRGMRRRLTSMFDRDRRQIELLYSLLFGLPGTLVLFYGEEIGMSENLELPGRLSVRTPMQWTAGVNGGFSRAAREHLVRPAFAAEASISGRTSVEEQQRDETSLLNWMRKLIHVRRECGEIKNFNCRMVETGSPSVLGIRYDTERTTLFQFHNLSSHIL
ncbi:MAG TPA: hypothetical protein VE734_04065 [Terriglobales bacterium]|jgi:maltose alpha-D-glucosyltransferase/alpha-amylase|nr:hypothetical protein [Terriglobales bacterium]